MSIHFLIRLAFTACLWCTGMAGAQAQVTAQPQTIERAYNVWGPVSFSATDTTPYRTT